jgi:hypothetical protein
MGPRALRPLHQAQRSLQIPAALGVERSRKEVLRTGARVVRVHRSDNAHNSIQERET